MDVPALLRVGEADLNLARVQRLLRKCYRPIGRAKYALFIVLFIDGPVGLDLHRALAGKGWWLGQPWFAVVFFLLPLVYVTSCRFLDIGLSPWLAAPYAIATFAPYLWLFRDPSINFRLPILGALVLQLPAMLCRGRMFDPSARNRLTS
jgi:hypothetical protein